MEEVRNEKGMREATLGKEGDDGSTMTTPLLGDPSSKDGGGTMKKKSSGSFLGRLGSFSGSFSGSGGES